MKIKNSNYSTEVEELMSNAILPWWQNITLYELLNGFSVKTKMRWQDFFLPALFFDYGVSRTFFKFLKFPDFCRFCHSVLLGFTEWTRKGREDNEECTGKKNNPGISEAEKTCCQIDDWSPDKFNPVIYEESTQEKNEDQDEDCCSGTLSFLDLFCSKETDYDKGNDNQRKADEVKSQG